MKPNGVSFFMTIKEFCGKKVMFSVMTAQMNVLEDMSFICMIWKKAYRCGKTKSLRDKRKMMKFRKAPSYVSNEKSV